MEMDLIIATLDSVFVILVMLVLLARVSKPVKMIAVGMECVVVMEPVFVTPSLEGHLTVLAVHQ